jgi:hypothetical protein
MVFGVIWYVLPSLMRWSWDSLISAPFSKIKPSLKRLPWTKIATWWAIVGVVYCVACGAVVLVGCLWEVFK